MHVQAHRSTLLVLHRKFPLNPTKRYKKTQASNVLCQFRSLRIQERDCARAEPGWAWFLGLARLQFGPIGAALPVSLWVGEIMGNRSRSSKALVHVCGAMASVSRHNSTLSGRDVRLHSVQAMIAARVRSK